MYLKTIFEILFKNVEGMKSSKHADGPTIFITNIFFYEVATEVSPVQCKSFFFLQNKITYR